MDYYRPIAANGYAFPALKRGSDDDRFVDSHGTSTAAAFEPVEIRWVTHDDGPRLRGADVSALSAAAMVFRPRALALLRDYLTKHGELLPLRADRNEETLWFRPPTRNALDRAHSRITYFEGTDRIMSIQAAAFFEDIVSGVDAFRLPGPAAQTVLSSVFVRKILEAGLEGLNFRKVWSSQQIELVPWRTLGKTPKISLSDL